MKNAVSERSVERNEILLELKIIISTLGKKSIFCGT